MSIAQTKSDIRKQLRQKRRSLSASQQKLAAQKILPICRKLLPNRHTKRVALYWAMDGEINLKPLIQQCWAQGIEVYLPILHAFKPTLWFARYEPNSQLFDNRFGIPEPSKSAAIRAWQLDCVLFPLVGFDEHGGRLGMGGGFYDRTFAQMQRWPSKPTLYGVAHHCQKVAQIPLESWDIPLAGVISDAGFYRASKAFG